jgi:hypothetical protein
MTARDRASGLFAMARNYDTECVFTEQIACNRAGSYRGGKAACERGLIPGRDQLARAQ